MTGVRRYEARHRSESVDRAYDTIAECKSQVDQGRSFIVLVLGNRKPPTGLKVKLTKREGPLGEVLSYNDRDGGSVVARFGPQAVSDFLKKKLREAGCEA